MITTESCRLCGSQTGVVQSHIIPAFAISWLKETSGTGRLRNPENPNVPRQDITRVKLLCQVCEERLSAWETEFSERVFLPSMRGGRFAFQYEEWLLRFAVSIAWRSALVQSDKFTLSVRNLADKVTEALQTWGAYLLSDRSDTGPYEHHIIIVAEPISAVEGVLVPPKFHSYMLRAVDTTLASSSKLAFVYTKLPGIILLAAIEPPKLEGMRGTRIRRRGVLSSPQTLGLPGFGEFLLARIRTTTRMLDTMSERQSQKMLDIASRDPERVLKSESYRAFRADQYWQDRLGNEQE